MDLTTIPAEVKHAFLSPSGAPAWLICNIKPHREKGMTDKASSFAAEGTAAHDLAERCLSRCADASEWIRSEIKVDDLTFTVDADMASFVQVYVDYVRDLAKGGEIMAEARLSIESITGEVGATGTSDAVAIVGDTMHVVDLKYGLGVRVSAIDNEQLMIYGAAALEQYDVLGDIATVVVHIVQPRMHHIECQAITADALRWHASEIRQVADLIMAGPDGLEAAPGEKQCKFCKAKATCPELRAHVLATVADDFVDLTQPVAQQIAHRPAADMDQQVLANCLGAVALVRGWCDAIEDKAHADLAAGIVVPGYKLVSGRRGHRTWASEAIAEQAMRSMRLKADDMYSRKVISPAQAEKLLKDTPRKLARLRDLVTQNDGKPVIASATDKRPAITAGADHFDIITKEQSA